MAVAPLLLDATILTEFPYNVKSSPKKQNLFSCGNPGEGIGKKSYKNPENDN